MFARVNRDSLFPEGSKVFQICKVLELDSEEYDYNLIVRDLTKDPKTDDTTTFVRKRFLGVVKIPHLSSWENLDYEPKVGDFVIGTLRLTEEGNVYTKDKRSQLSTWIPASSKMVEFFYAVTRPLKKLPIYTNGRKINFFTTEQTIQGYLHRGGFDEDNENDKWSSPFKHARDMSIFVSMFLYGTVASFEKDSSFTEELVKSLEDLKVDVASSSSTANSFTEDSSVQATSDTTDVVPLSVSTPVNKKDTQKWVAVDKDNLFGQSLKRKHVEQQDMVVMTRQEFATRIQASFNAGMSYAALFQ